MNSLCAINFNQNVQSHIYTTRQLRSSINRILNQTRRIELTKISYGTLERVIQFIISDKIKEEFA